MDSPAYNIRLKIKPMLGEFALDHIEHIESSESRALVEHRVPGLSGNYFQDMGTVPNTIVIHGTKHGDETHGSFLESIREVFNIGEPTTFVADINAATDLSDDSPAVQQLSAAHGLVPSELIPTGQDAVLILDPDSPLDTPPTILLRREVLNDPTG
jgi:hypothetical protein